MYISPRHTRDQFPNPLTLEEKIEVFHARIDGWQLEVADRCINGWSENGRQCISATDQDGKPAPYIPDSGWAVMQITLSYFETIAIFKYCLLMDKTSSSVRFKKGVEDVFPVECHAHKDFPNWLFNEFRTSMYHAWLKNSPISIKHTDDTTVFHFRGTQPETVVIDPHNFVKALRRHLENYISELRDPVNVDLRGTFVTAYDATYST
jgi:hypothetical protein